jgi:glycosyltransferase EpsE
MSGVAISVLMSCYNSEKTVQKSIESIISQSFQDYELIIIDDGSKDGTEEILNKYEKEEKIKIFTNKKNIGLTKSLNTLIKISKGKYIARQDADDISLPQRFEKQIDYMKKHETNIVTARSKIIGENRIIPAFSYYLPNKVVVRYKNPFIHGTLMIEKSLLVKSGGYDENFYYSQDYKLFYDLVKQGYKIPIIKEVLYELNMKNNISSKFSNQQRYYSQCVRKNLSPSKLND